MAAVAAPPRETPAVLEPETPTVLDSETHAGLEPARIKMTSHTGRWGKPIWQPDEPIAQLDRPAPVQRDVIALAFLLGRHD